MKGSKMLRLLGVGVVAFALAPAAFAAPQTFFGEDFQTGLGGTDPNLPHPKATAAETSFLSNLQGVTTENFESFALNTSAPIVTHFGADTATLTGANTFINNTASGLGFSGFATSGTKFLQTTSDISINFNKAQAAFGFFGVDIGDSGATSLILTLGNGTNEQVPVPAKFNNTANGSVLFFGLIAPKGEEFTSVKFANNSAGADIFAFDDMTIGNSQNVKPPPTNIPLPAAGWAGLGMFGAMGLVHVVRSRFARTA